MYCQNSKASISAAKLSKKNVILTFLPISFSSRDHNQALDGVPSESISKTANQKNKKLL